MGQAMAQWYLAPQKETSLPLGNPWLKSWNRSISWGRCSPEWSAHTGASKGRDVLWYSCFQVGAFKFQFRQTCNLFIKSARISLKSSTMTARWTGVCNWHTSRNERSAWSSCHAEAIFLNCVMPCWNFQRFQVIMKVRSKADLRSALMRTLILGVLFGLTFLQIEKTQSDTWHPKLRQTEQVIRDSSFGAWWLAFLECNCVDKTAVQPTPCQKSTDNLVWHFGHWLPSPGPFHHQRLHLLHNDDGSHEHCNLSQKSRFADLMSCDLCFFAFTFPKFLKSHGHPLGPVHVGSNGHPDANANVDSWTSQWSLWSVKLNFHNFHCSAMFLIITIITIIKFSSKGFHSPWYPFLISSFKLVSQVIIFFFSAASGMKFS